MSPQFIHPSWHPLLVHAPLAFIGVGIFLEIVTVLWRPSEARKAGRWMIFFGALLSLPAATCGIYALRDAIAPGGADSDTAWSDIKTASLWSSGQWEYMFLHLKLAATGAGISAAGATMWAGASDRWRRRLYLLVLLMILAGAGLMSVAGYYSGESVYTQGTGVTTAPSKAAQRSLEYYAPPLQAHATLAGFVLAFVLGALAVTMRRWSYKEEESSPMIEGADRSIYDAVAAGGGQMPPLEAELPQRVKIFPTRFWLLAFLISALTAAAGLWTSRDLDVSEVRRLFSSAQSRSDNPRLFAHVLLGTSIVILTLLLSGMTLMLRKWRKTAGILALLLLLTLASQMYVGALMTFDSMSGPLMHLNSSTEENSSSQSHSHQ